MAPIELWWIGRWALLGGCTIMLACHLVQRIYGCRLNREALAAGLCISPPPAPADASCRLHQFSFYPSYAHRYACSPSNFNLEMAGRSVASARQNSRNFVVVGPISIASVVLLTVAAALSLVHHSLAFVRANIAKSFCNFMHGFSKPSFISI
jgi:hypothetical protein